MVVEQVDGNEGESTASQNFTFKGRGSAQLRLIRPCTVSGGKSGLIWREIITLCGEMEMNDLLSPAATAVQVSWCFRCGWYNLVRGSKAGLSWAKGIRGNWGLVCQRKSDGWNVGKATGEGGRGRIRGDRLRISPAREWGPHIAKLWPD